MCRLRVRWFWYTWLNVLHIWRTEGFASAWEYVRFRYSRIPENRHDDVS